MQLCPVAARVWSTEAAITTNSAHTRATLHNHLLRVDKGHATLSHSNNKAMMHMIMAIVKADMAQVLEEVRCLHEVAEALR